MSSAEDIQKNDSIPEIETNLPYTPSHKNVLKSALGDLKHKQEVGNKKHFYYIRMILVLTGVASFVIGVYILYKKEYYLNSLYKFSLYKLLFGFILLYFSGMISVLFLSFIFAVIIYLGYCCCFKPKLSGDINKDAGNISMTGNEILPNTKDSYVHIDTSIEKAFYDSQKARLVPYTCTIFILLTITLYFLALPYGGFLIYKMLKNVVYKEYMKFLMLYIFFGINIFNGILMVIVFFIMLCRKRIELSLLKKSMDLDENYITSIRNEVRNEMNKVK